MSKVIKIQMCPHCGQLLEYYPSTVTRYCHKEGRNIKPKLFKVKSDDEFWKYYRLLIVCQYIDSKGEERKKASEDIHDLNLMMFTDEWKTE